MDWQHDFTDEELSAAEGFVYVITNDISGKAYIGKKYFTAIKGKKKIESDWKRYWGSCKPLKEDIDLLGKENFSRHILSIHPTRSETDFAEVTAQFKNDVLTATLPDGSRAFYNGNICSRWFVPKTGPKARKPKLSDEERQRRAERAGNRMRGTKLSEAQKEAISRARTGIKENISEEERAKRRERGRKLSALKQSPQSIIRSSETRRANRTGLTDDDIRTIRAAHGVKLKDLSAQYGISIAHASKIRLGKTHPHVR